jgi:CubicO group peptidase (beta-lactamase class C family)
MPLLAKPGENVVYSCLGFILLGRICELVSGTGLDHLAQQLVFNPLGLKNTGYTPKMQGNTFAATEYCSTSGVWLNGVVHDENARFMGGVSGNAGVFSNINDCAALAIMFANKGNGIVPQALFEAATQNLTTHCEEGRGLGFAVKGRAAVSCGNIFSQGSYGHTGFTGTSMWVDGETSQYVVFLTNRVHPTRENNQLAGFRSVLHDVCAREYQTFMQW